MIDEMPDSDAEDEEEEEDVPDVEMKRLVMGES